MSRPARNLTCSRLQWSYTRYRGDESSECQLSYVLIQVFSGKVPFHEVAYLAVTAAILNGKRPSRPNHPSFHDALWNLTQKCWNDSAKNRPEMNNVTEELKGMLVFSFLKQSPYLLPYTMPGNGFPHNHNCRRSRQR